MSEHDPDILDKVRQWLSFADDDLRVATHSMTLPGKELPYRLIAYHAQQCAEKCLKAFLVYHRVDFPYTHNIRRLLKLCGKHTTWAQTLKDAEALTPYVITARYPGESEEVSGEEAQRAIEIAQQVRDQVRAALEELGLKLPRQS